MGTIMGTAQDRVLSSFILAGLRALPTSIPVSRSHKKKGQLCCPFFLCELGRMEQTRLAGENHLRAALRSQMILGVHHAEFA